VGQDGVGESPVGLEFLQVRKGVKYDNFGDDLVKRRVLRLLCSERNVARRSRPRVVDHRLSGRFENTGP